MDSSDKKTVLIVNDIPDQREMAQIIFQQAGYRVLTASDGCEAFQRAKSNRLDLIISDVMMPGGDGIELCRRIRSDEKLRNLPVLLVSALRKDLETVIEGLKVGADDYIELPIEPLGLVVRAERLIERRRTERALIESEVRFKAQYKGLPIPTYTWRKIDDDFVLTDYNDAAEKITAGKTARLIGEKAHQLYSDMPEMVRNFNRCFDEQTVINHETTYKYRVTDQVKQLDISYVFVPPDIVMVHTHDVTESRRIEKDLRESEERYRVFLAQSSEAIWRFETEPPCPVNLTEDEQIEWLYRCGYLAECNDAMARMYGYESAGEITGARIGDMLPQTDPANIEYLRNFIRSGYKLADAETHEIDKDGNPRIFSNSLSGVIEDGRVMRVWGVQRDITEQRLTENELRRSETNLADAQRITHLGSWEVELSDLQRINNNKVRWSDEVYRIFGYKPGEIRVSIKCYFDFVHADDRKYCRQAFVEAITERKDLNIEFRICLPTGGERILHGLAEVIYDERSNQPQKFIGTVQDITERKMAERVLESSQARLRKQNKVLTKLTKRHTLFRNSLDKSISEIVEIAAQTLDTARVSVWLYADNKSKIRAVDLYELETSRHTQGLELTQAEYPFYFQALAKNSVIAAADACADARTREFAESYLIPLGITSLLDVPIRFGGQTVGVVCHEHIGAVREWKLDEQNFAGSMADLISLLLESNERRQAENALRRSQQQYESLVHSIDGIVWELDAQTLHLNFLSKQVERLLGYQPEQMIGGADAWESHIHEDDRARVFGVLAEAVETKQDTEFDYRMITADGRVIWMRTLVAVEVAGGEAKCLRGIVVDITDRKRSEEALKQSERDYHTVFEQAHDAIIIFAPEGETVLDVNRRACELYGFSRAEFIGKSIETISKNPENGKNRVEETLKARENLNFETVQYRKDGTEMFLEVNASTIIYQGQEAIITINRDITERKRQAESLARASDLLRQSEESYRIVAETASDVIVTIDEHAVIQFVNPAAEKVLGYKPSEMIGENLSIIVPERFRAAHRAGMTRYMQTNERRISWSGVEMPALCRDGREIQMEISFGEYRESDKRLFTAIIRDITERKLVKEDLQKSLSLLTSTFEATADGIAVFDSNFNIVNYNNKFLEMWRVSEDAVKGRNNAEAMPLILDQLADPAAFLQSTERAQSKLDEAYSDVIEFKDGRIYERYIKPQSLDGSVIGQVLSFRDITERKRAERDIRFQAHLLDTVEQAVIATDIEGTVIYWNEFAQTLYGWSAAEAVGCNIINLTTPDASVGQAEEIMHRLLDGKSWTGEFQVQNRAGETFPAAVSNSPIYADTGNLIGVVGVSNDITERKQAEQALVEANERAIREYERLIDRVAQLAESLGTARDLQTIYRALYSFAVISVPCTGFFISLYDAQRNVRLPGYAASDGEETDVSALPPMEMSGSPNSRAIATGMIVIEDDFQSAMAGKPIVNIGLDKHPDVPQSCLVAPMSVMGRIVGAVEVQSTARAAYTKEHATAMRMAANLAANAIENVRLIEQERERAEQLRLSQKLESVGRLAGGIAHDFNNMLTAINGYSELTLRRLGTDDPLRANVEEIKKAGERSAALTHQLLAFSRQQVLQSRVLDLNEIINDTIQMLNRLIGENIRLETVLDARLGCVEADAGQLAQVLMNLAVNARDAMPEGGNLTIETANVRLDEEYVTQHFSIKPGAYVLLAVSDTGTGIDAETQQHIFEPFFTTKEIGKGTGLGLATVYGIVKQSGGYIWVYSEAGHGTSFKIYLPRVDEAAQETESVESESAPQGAETVLIVEDEDVVRALTRQMLEESGYRVIEARNGVEALAICEERNYKIDLLMTDVVMPQMGGRELAEKLALVEPRLRVLFTSGYTDDAIIRHNIIEADTNFIQKPFTFDALAHKVRETLDGED